MSIAIYLCVILCLFFFPEHTAATARDALKIWASDILPTLFPYMVFCRLLCGKLRSLPIPAAPAAALLGLIGGSPSGASVISSYGPRLSGRALCTLCALTGTISPMFLLGTVPAWMHMPELGPVLLISHWIGAAFSAVCAFATFQCFSVFPPTKYSASDVSDSSALAQSIDAILQVGGCIVCCSVAAGMATKLASFQHTAGAFVHSLLEISGGIYAVSSIQAPADFRFLSAAALCGFTSFSILSQNYAVLRPLGIRFQQLFAFACLRALGSAAAMAVFLHV